MRPLTRAILISFAVALPALADAAPDRAPQDGINQAEAVLLEQRIELPQIDRASRAGLPDFFTERSLKSFESPFELFGRRDSDNDGLKDDEEAALGTDPANRDTDGDALIDGWEVHGVNDIDLRALGASPRHKDVFVQMDYMERADAANGLGPNPTVIAGIRDAFANAPVSNPDGTGGIDIHLIAGNKLGYMADMSPVETVVQAFKRRSFDPKRAPVFHYMIWANGYDGDTSSGYSLTIPGSDFVVTLGRWHEGAGGTDAEKIGTFVHELGHNLGLHHGNYDDDNYKPNHLSVMNYSFQLQGIRVGGAYRYSYQRIDLPMLDEAALDEMAGLGSQADLVGGSTIWFDPHENRFYEGPTGGAIDWNLSGVTDAASVEVDLDGGGSFASLGGTSAEWPRLVYPGGAIGQRTRLQGLLARPLERAPLAPKNELNFEQSRRVEQRTTTAALR